MKRQILDYDNPHIVGSSYKKTKNKKLTGKGVKIVAVFVCLSLVTATIFAFVLNSAKNIFKLKEFDYYILILAKEDTIDLAQSQQSLIESGGGSGYIINDEQFLISAFVYKSKSDAQLILSRLAATYKDADILQYKITKTKIKRFGSKKQESQLKKSTEFAITIIDNVLDFVFLLDSYQNTEAEVLLKANQLQGELKQNMEQLDSFLLADSSNAFPKFAYEVKAFLTEFYQKLYSLTTTFKTEKKLTHLLKNYACEICHKYYLLRGQIAAIYI